ncbi:MAG: MATE family efflux transporter [Cobetia marina]|jgi:MATE family multidrug resistance protein
MTDSSRQADPSSPSAARTDRHLWQLAWPIILSNISVPLLGLVDTAVVGHLEDAIYLGAVTLGAVLFSFLYWGFGFLRMGTTGMTAQAHGRGDHDRLRTLLGQGILLALAIGMLLMLLGSPLISLGLGLMEASETTRALAHDYASIRLWSAPAVLINYVILGWFLGLGNSRVTLGILVLTNVLNIVLDLAFVPGLGMTSDGVALASVIADYCGLAAGLWLVSRQLSRTPGHSDRAALLSLSAWSILIRVNQHLFVRTLCLLGATAYFTSQGASFGDETLAANAVLLQFVMITSYGLDGFAQAAESEVGRAVGQGDWQRFTRSVRAATRFSLVTAAAASLLLWLLGPQMIALLTDLPEVRQLAITYLPWMVAMPLVAVWSYLLDGIFIGATATREMRNTLVVSLLAFIGLWPLLESFGNHGLWLAFLLFTSVRSVVLGGYYLHHRRHHWR